MAQAEVHRQLGRDTPYVVHIGVDGDLVAVVCEGASAAFAKIGWRQVLKEFVERGVLVVAALPLCELLRRDVLAPFDPELEIVVSFRPADVVHGLVKVLHR